jgi:hypothetical protein
MNPGVEARVMLCAVWQSVQTGAPESPAASFWPWMLVAYVSEMPSWQRPQVWATCARLAVERGSEVGRTAWYPWQSTQVAATLKPDFDTARP